MYSAICTVSQSFGNAKGTYLHLRCLTRFWICLWLFPMLLPNHVVFHCVKRVCIRSYSGPHFPTFRLNTERHRVFLAFSPNVGNADQNNSKYGHFLRSAFCKLASTIHNINKIIEDDVILVHPNRHKGVA